MAGACGPRGARGARRSYQDIWADLIRAQSTYRAPFTLPNVYSLNVNSPTDGARALVNSLVRLDRLPASNPLEGLLLLQDAWRDFDVALLLAARYKRLCKFTFFLQLALGCAHCLRHRDSF